MLQAIEGLINPDGRIILKDFVMPKKPIRVKVIIMDNKNYQETDLSDRRLFRTIGRL